MEQLLTQEAWKAFGWFGVIALVAIIGTVFFLKHWITSRITSTFDLERESHRRASEAQLRDLQLNIDRELDRARLLNAKEFEVLGKLWTYTCTAFERTLALTNPEIRVQHFELMTDPAIEAFIHNCTLELWEKEEMRKLPHAEKTWWYVKRSVIRS